ncbi:MAK10-like protein [Tanacetum coccineum]
MGDENPIRTLGDYSRPSHEGYRNTIELPDGKNMDPNQHLKDFLKLVDSLDLDVANRERTRLYLFQFSFRDQAINWIERLPTGFISTWEDLTTRFLAHFFPPGRTAKLQNDILMFQQRQDVLSTSDRHLIKLENQVQRLMEARLAPKSSVQVNKITYSCEICSGPHDTQYCMENPEQAFVDYASSRLVSNFMASQDARLSKFKADFKQQQSEMTNKIDTVLKAINDRIMGALPILAHAPMYIAMLDNYVKSLELGKNRLANGTKSYPVGIVKKIEVHIGRLKLLDDFYVIDMDKDPTTPLLVGRGFLATANAVPYWTTLGKQESYKPRPSTDGIGARPTNYAKKDVIDYHLPDEWEIARDVMLNQFKDVLVFRRMVEFLGVILINLKGSIWKSENLIKDRIDWNKPPKRGDGAWHAKIILIDPDGEEFTKTFQSIPTTRKLSEKDNPSEIIDLGHFHDS